MKTCTTCNQEKPLDEYYDGQLTKDGYANKCKSCVVERQKAYYAANKAKITHRTLAYKRKLKTRAEKRARA